MSQAYRDNNYKSMKKSSRKHEKAEKGCGCEEKNKFMPLMDPNNLKIKKVGK
jgi:hypothetical protein